MNYLCTIVKIFLKKCSSYLPLTTEPLRRRQVRHLPAGLGPVVVAVVVVVVVTADGSAVVPAASVRVRPLHTAPV